MDKKQQPKKHHYVPQCYLKNFTVNNQLYVLDIRKVQKGYKEVPTLRHTASICYFPNYYTIADHMGSVEFQLNTYDSLHIEREVLSHLENKYGKIYEKISRSIILQLQDAIDLIDFIIQLKLRNPYWMEETLKKKKDKLIDSAMDGLDFSKYSEDPRFEHIPQQVLMAIADAVKDTNKSNPTFSKEMQLFSLIQRSSTNENRNEIFRLPLIDYKWTIYEAPEHGPYFITSDNPGYSLKPNDDKTYNTNYSHPFEFFFPLSSKLCLVISSQEKDHSYTNKSSQKIYQRKMAPANKVIDINNASMQCITNLLIATDTWYLSKVAELNSPKNKKNIRS
ncbi:DUF4238 domain-containing protein [Flavobacterium lindanitolerans]|uniref:DUF4238 domain-containing protein n=1 Tax=Flavobacterium lindanitolerans TaxID=428988 RepID=UPI0027BA7583|nr:DUF4238 domain-containing protein [Flavobacterium lindanitolerans]